MLSKLNCLSLPCVETQGGQFFFIAKDVEQMKGHSGDHFKRSYHNFVKTDKYQPHKFDISPTLLTLEGDVLKSFKKRYASKYNRSLGSINKLHVLNTTATYNYLFPEEVAQMSTPSASSQVTVDTNTNTNTKKPKPQLQSQPQLKTTVLSIFNSEDELVTQLAALSAYTATPFRREMTVLNTFVDQSARTRRYDLSRVRNGTTEVYEVKNTPLTSEQVSITLGDKGYIHLLDCSDVSFFFVAPSVTPAADRLLSVIPSVQFLTVDQLVQQLLSEMKQDTPSQGHWFLKKVIEQFAPVFNLNINLD